MQLVQKMGADQFAQTSFSPPAGVIIHPDVVVGLVGLESPGVVRITLGGLSGHYATIDLDYLTRTFLQPVFQAGVLNQWASQPVLARTESFTNPADQVNPIFLSLGSYTMCVRPGGNWVYPSEGGWAPHHSNAPKFTQTAIDPSNGVNSGIRSVVTTRRNHLPVHAPCNDNHDSLFLCTVDGDGARIHESFLGFWDSLAVGPAIGDLGGDSRTEAVILVNRNCPELDLVGPVWRPMIKGISNDPHESYQFGWENHRHDAARRASTGVLWEIPVPNGEEVVWSDEIWINGNIEIPSNSVVCPHFLYQL